MRHLASIIVLAATLLTLCSSTQGADKGTVSGKLLLQNGNTPLEGLSVAAYPNEFPWPGSQIFASTDAQGKFQFELAPGRWSIVFDQSELSDRKLFLPRPRSVDVAEGNTQELSIKIYPAEAKLKLRIEDSEHTPVPLISAQFDMPAQGIETTHYSDPQGLLEIDLIPGEWRYSISAYGLNALGLLGVPDGTTILTPGTNFLTLTAARPTIALRAQISSSAGTLISNTQFRLSQYQTPFNTFLGTNSAEGLLEMKLGPGKWQLQFGDYTAPASNSVHASTFEINLTSNMVEFQTNIVFPAIDSLLIGIVRSDKGEVIPRANVILRGTINSSPTFDYATADETGHYSVRLVSTTWTVEVTEADSLGLRAPAPQEVTLASEAKNIDFILLTPPNQLSGVVRDDSGTPLTNVIVRLHGRTTVRGGEQYSTITDLKGAYRIGLFPGEWVVQADVSNLPEQKLLSPGYLDILALPGMDLSQDLTLTRTTHTIQVRLVNEQTLPIAGYWAGSCWKDGKNFTISVFATNGLSVLNVISGVWLLEFRPQTGWMPPTPNDPIETGLYSYPLPQVVMVSETNVTLELIAKTSPVVGEISGQLQNELGQPLSPVELQISQNSARQRIFTDGQGRFTTPIRLGPISISSYDSKIRDEYLMPPIYFDVFYPGSRNITITARKGTVPLTVILENPQGRNLDNINISVSSWVNGESYQSYPRSISEPNTYYVFPGTWRIRAETYSDLYFSPELDVLVGTEPKTVTISLHSPEPTSTIVGQALKHDGTPLPNLNVEAFNTQGFTNAVTSSTGGFNLKVAPGTWRVGARNEFLVATTSVEVGDGVTKDMGALIFPEPTASLTVIGLDPTGIQIPLRFGNLRSTNGTTNYFGNMLSLTVGQLDFKVPAGRWTLTVDGYDLIRYGFLTSSPIELDLQPGTRELEVRLQPLPATRPLPSLSISKAQNMHRLLIHYPTPDAIDLESTSDLINWERVDTYYPYNGFSELHFPLFDPLQFYRARSRY